MTSHERKLFVFEYTIKFLEIYGNENFGASATINWPAVFEHCTKCDMLDFNQEVEEIVYNTKEEDFRDAVFAYLEKQAIEGYPLWRLFNMSKWLMDKCEEQLKEDERKKDIDYFNQTKCYHCKHFRNELAIMYSLPIESIVLKNFENIEEFKKVPGVTKVKSIGHDMGCAVRDRILKEATEAQHYESSWRNEHFAKEYKFKYKRFNNPDTHRGSWKLNPRNLVRCPYFEESGMTPEKFIELYTEIPRYAKED